MPDELSFRPLTRADFPVLQAWLEDPEVHRWWHHQTTDEALERDFGPVIDGAEPAEDFVGLVGDRPVAHLQRSRFEDYPDEEETRALASAGLLPPGAMTVDYLVGAAADRGRGVGTLLVGAFVERLWADHPGVPAVVVPVAAGNRASWRTLERIGFAVAGEVDLPPDNPADPPRHLVLRRDRPAGPPVTPAPSLPPG